MLCNQGYDMTCPFYNSYKQLHNDNGCMCDYCFEEEDQEDDEDDADK